MTDHTDIDPAALGPNMWLIDEMYRRYRENPDAVGDSWKEFFEDFTPKLQPGADGAASAPPSVGAPEETAEPAVRPAESAQAEPPERPETAPSASEGPSQATGVRKETPPEGAERLRFGAE